MLRKGFLRVHSELSIYENLKNFTVVIHTRPTLTLLKPVIIMMALNISHLTHNGNLELLSK